MNKLFVIWKLKRPKKYFPCTLNHILLITYQKIITFSECSTPNIAFKGYIYIRAMRYTRSIIEKTNELLPCG